MKQIAAYRAGHGWRAGGHHRDDFKDLFYSPFGPAAVYSIAGLAYSMVLGAAMVWQSPVEGVVPWLCLTIAFAWPTLLIALVMAGVRRRIIATIATICFIAYWIPPTVSPPLMDPMVQVFLANVGATFILLIMRVRLP